MGIEDLKMRVTTSAPKVPEWRKTTEGLLAHSQEELGHYLEIKSFWDTPGIQDTNPPDQAAYRKLYWEAFDAIPNTNPKKRRIRHPRMPLAAPVVETKVAYWSDKVDEYTADLAEAGGAEAGSGVVVLNQEDLSKLKSITFETA